MNSKTGLRRRALALGVAVGCGMVCAAAFAGVPANTRFTTLSKATFLRPGDRVTAPLPLTAKLHVTVALKLRNADQLRAYNSKPHAPISRTALAANYLPTAAQANAVVQYLQQAGFQDINVSPDRLLVTAIGSNVAVRQGFKATMVAVHTIDGRNAYAHSSTLQIPASLADSVLAVTGLQTVHKMHTLAHPAVVVGAGIMGHDPTEFASIYGADALPAATNVNVAVWGWGSMAQTVTDLDTFLAAPNHSGISAGTVNVVCTDYGSSRDSNGNLLNGGTTHVGDASCDGISDAGSTEWDMDSQDILGMTGGVASLTFYAAADAYDDTLLDALEAIVTPPEGVPMAQVVNASFGGCERGADINQQGDGSMQAMDELFATAAAQGQTFSISTGDSGFDECGDGAMDSASYPASSPWVIAASGTTLRATTTSFARENVWNLAGGSPSSAEQAQSWQAPLTYGPYKGMRGPDVAFDADPASGAVFYNHGQLIQVGGTSLSAPLFAGAWARILESNPGLGFAAPHLYALPASAFHDVTTGNNRGGERTGGYPARVGWDWATGRGSLDVGAAAAALGGEGQPE